MWFPFCLQMQQRRLMQYGLTVAATVKAANIHLTTNNAATARGVYDAYSYFYSNVKTTTDKIKSYIPGTKLFTLRTVCAKRIAELRADLQKTERFIKQLPPPRNVVRVSRSDSSVPSSTSTTQERVYKSPISQRPFSKNWLITRTTLPAFNPRVAGVPYKLN